MIILLLIFGILIGLSLGLTGAGGSILAVPLLIYGAGTQPLAAIHISLLVVTVTALIGTLGVIRGDFVSRRAALIFASTGMLAAPVGVKVGSLIDPVILIMGFAMLMMAVSVNLWRSSQSSPGDAGVVRADLPEDLSAQGAVCRHSTDGKLRMTAPCALVLALSGLAAGALSGLFGVGGGFIIVPILMYVTQMSIHHAVATSLLVITLIGVSGAATVVMTSSLIDWPVAMPFIFGGALGMLAGRILARKIAGTTLQKIFAVAVFLIGIGMLIRQWTGA